MTIVDKYIADHKDKMTNGELAARIGVSEEFVAKRKCVPFKQVPTILVTAEEEIHALVQFALERKTGYLVDIAERRIRDISKSLNR